MLISILFIASGFLLKYSPNSADKKYKKYWWILLVIGSVKLILEFILFQIKKGNYWAE